MKRYIPEGSTEVQHDDINAVVYYREADGKWYATGYSGKRSKPDFSYRFNSEFSRFKHIKEWLENLRELKKIRDDRKALQKAFRHGFKKGDILYCSWGWEQTNIDFYQVTKVVSDKTVKIRRIHGKDVGNNQGHFMSATKVAVKDAFKAGTEEMLKRVQSSNGKPYIRINSYSWTTPWDGTPMNYSWYA